MRLAFTKIPQEVDVVKVIIDGHSRLIYMGLDENDFDTVAGYLLGTFQELNVDQMLISEAVIVVAQLRAIFEAGAQKD